MAFCGLDLRSLRGQRYYSLPSNSTADGSRENRIAFSVVKNVARRCIILLALVVIVMTGSLFLGIRPNNFYHQSHTDVPPETRSFHLLVPSNQKNPNLAKTLLSAAICTFPIPTIINWGITFNTKHLAAGGAHLGKISGTLSYLNSLPPSADNDLVLLIDGYDIWFQLHPSVLINRYLEINRLANQRIRKSIGKRAMKDHKISQSILISPQKRCWPRDDNDASCYAVPESTLSEYIYGPRTDKFIHRRGREYTKFRPRFLNSGVIMGDAGHMRALFTRAVEKMEVDRNFGSDQNIFADIFGEQEFQREIIRNEYLGLWSRFWRRLGFGEGSVLNWHPTHRKPAWWEEGPDGDFEFGVGMDYDSSLGHTTAFSEYDTAWLQLNDPVAIRKAKEKLKVDTNYEIRLPEDIAVSAPPFPENSDELGLPVNVSWTEISLHTNLYTSNIPSMVHLNGRQNKFLRQKDWHKTWFQPFARTLFTSYVQTESRAIAVTVDEEGREVEWIGLAKEDRSLVRLFGKDGPGQIGWEELFAGYENELFRDGIGMWEDPTEEDGQGEGAVTGVEEVKNDRGDKDDGQAEE